MTTCSWQENLQELEDCQQIKEEDLFEEYLKFNGNTEFKLWMKKIGFPDCKATVKQIGELVKYHYNDEYNYINCKDIHRWSMLW